MKGGFVIALVVFSLTAFGQDRIIDPTRVYANSNGILYELKPRPTNPTAKYFYISDFFKTGDIYLRTGQKLSNVPIRYDIMRNRMEISFEDELKVLYASKIDSFTWFNPGGTGKSKFVRCKRFKDIDEDMKGFLQVIAEGPLTLGSYTYLKVYPATSSVSLSGSHRDHNIFKKEDFFVIAGDELDDFPKKRKEALTLMADHRDAVKRYMRQHGLIFSRKDDLIKIVRYYNTLN